MIHVSNPADCCGCTACASVCSQNAITMEPDALGFLYPKVQENKCIHCGLCEKVCAFNSNYDVSNNLEKPIGYGVRHKNIDELKYSRSGGAFVAFSDYILSQGGFVYGVGYGDHFHVVHKKAMNKNEAGEFKGSKYVQSDLRGVFRQVKQDLKDGKIVLFTGTPCQTAGLNSYIGKKLRENLFLIDIVCHAAPSPKLWEDYLTAVEKKYKSKVKNVFFRDKTYGWKAPHKERFVFENGKEITEFTHRELFYASLSTRNSCHDCKFTNTQRPSDITIGDFWGYDKIPETKIMNEDNRGISVLFVNTEKGIKLLNAVKASIEYVNVPIEKCMQSNLLHSTPPSKRREEFVKDYVEKGFIFIAKKYANWGIKSRLQFQYQNLKKKIKSFL